MDGFGDKHTNIFFETIIFWWITNIISCMLYLKRIACGMLCFWTHGVSGTVWNCLPSEWRTARAAQWPLDLKDFSFDL